jgi:hypothetical protein
MSVFRWTLRCTILQRQVDRRLAEFTVTGAGRDTYPNATRTGRAKFLDLALVIELTCQC